jgi:tRNA A37 threonylcarbamoyladenosine modification protein TsaB
MKVLALDACTVTASAAVLDGDAVLAECACGVRATHAEARVTGCRRR